MAETAESTSSTPPLAYEYIWFGGQPVAQVDVATSTTHWTFTDHLGTPIVQTDATGAPDWRVEYDPYGTAFSYRQGATRHQTLRFPGQEYDSVAGEREYNVFRWYREGWGRYTQPDPLLRVEPVSWDTPSPYDYAGNNPINHFDDLGLFTKCVKPSSYQNIGPLSLLHHQPFFKPSWLFNLFWYDAQCGTGQCCDQKVVNPTVVPDAVSGSAPWASAIGFAAPTVQFVKWVKEPCHAQIGVSTKTTFNLLFGMANFQQFGQHIQVCFDCEKK